MSWDLNRDSLPYVIIIIINILVLVNTNLVTIKKTNL